MKKLVVLSLAMAAFAAIPASAFAKGGSGVVTPFHVGSLTMNGSTDADVRAFAGRPDRVTYCSDRCRGSGFWKTFVYRFPGLGRTEYTFNQFPSGKWYLEQFYTSLQRFRTQRGTKVGMTLRQAERREHLPNLGGCGINGLLRVAKQNGQSYLAGVGVNYPPRRVLNLQAFGPYPLPC